MTWQKWWTLEILAGIGLGVVTLPLSMIRLVLAIILAALFATFYQKRMTSQRNTLRRRP